MAEYNPTMRMATFLRHPGRLRGSKKSVVSYLGDAKSQVKRWICRTRSRRFKLKGSHTLGILTRRRNEDNTLMRV